MRTRAAVEGAEFHGPRDTIENEACIRQGTAMALALGLFVGYAVLDLDNSRVGLIRLDAAEKVLMDLRDSIR